MPEQELPYLYKKISNMLRQDLEEHNKRKRDIDRFVAQRFRLTLKDLRRINKEFKL